MRARESRPSKAEAAPEAFGGAGDKFTGSGSAGNAPAAPLAVNETQNEIIERVTGDYLASLDADDPPAPSQIERELLAATNFAFGLENANRQRDNKIALLRTLTFSQVAQLMVHLHRVVKVTPSGKNTDADYDLLAFYCPEGDDEGIYLTSEDQIRAVARRYNRQMTIQLSKEVFTVLRELAPRVTRCKDRDLIAVGNGIFDYAAKELLPFSPEHVFLSKSAVPYDAAAASPVLDTPGGGTWEIEEWMHTLSDDPEVVELLWQVIGALIRPHVRWNKSAWFYSEKGNSGKGTLVELMRNLCGPSAYCSIPLNEMGKDFMLEPLTRASAVLVDENDVGTYVDKAANLKAIVTNDVLMINRKGKMPISYQFWGFMVQCLNEFPRIKDKSDSFYRRQLFIPFDHSFTDVEQRYIKDDFMGRDEVLAYVLKRVLHMDYYVLDEPDSVRAKLDEFKEANDPVRQFWADMRTQFSWDLLPFPFLYELYLSWFSRTNPSGAPAGRNNFLRQLRQVVEPDPEWADMKDTLTWSKGRMDGPEMLIGAYEVKGWYSRTYAPPRSGPPDLDKLCTPSALSPSYRGLLRTAPAPAQAGSGPVQMAQLPPEEAP